MNTSVSPKTGFKPSSMVFGTDNPCFAFLDTEKLAPPHFMVKNNQQHTSIEKLTTELNEMTRQATEQLIQLK
jgi:diadenosine tetraphosphate (Ap4A) HIT family hydrolase